MLRCGNQARIFILVQVMMCICTSAAAEGQFPPPPDATYRNPYPITVTFTQPLGDGPAFAHLPSGGAIMRGESGGAGLGHARMTNLADVSSSLDSQLSLGQASKLGSGILSDVTLKYNQDDGVWEALESGVESLEIIPFRIESDIPISIGDGKIYRNIPFDCTVESATVFAPEGIASGNINLGLDTYFSGVSFPDNNAKQDMIAGLVSHPADMKIASTDGNTFYKGITYGGIHHGLGGWGTTGMSADSVLSINVDTNTANINTIIGDIIIRRKS